MAESHVITGLVAKRAELSGLLNHHRKEIDRLSEEIKALDATIKLFEPEYCIRSITKKRFYKKNEFFKAGEANRAILDVLREADKPVNTRDIAKAIMDRQGIASQQSKALQASLLTTLHRQKKNGLVKMVGKEPSGACIWVLTDE